MVETAKELKFAFIAGSSIPVVPRIPAVEMPWEAEIQEALCVAIGAPDGYDIHALEAIQCMVERHESRIVGVRGWDPGFFETCLCRSHTLAPARDGFNHVYPAIDQMPGLVRLEPIAYRIEYADGLKVTMLLLEGLVGDFAFAARLKGRRELLSTLMYVPHPQQGHFFNPLINNIEKMFLIGKPTYPLERTLLTTGLTEAGVESLWRGQVPLKTPHLAICYTSTKESTYWKS